MNNILLRPGWNSVLEEKAGRKYSKKLNHAISELVDRDSLGSNPAQKIQRIANALHKHYADTSFSNKEIIEYIKTEVPAIKLKNDSSESTEKLYTADNQWNSVYIEPEESSTQPTIENDYPTLDNNDTYPAETQDVEITKENKKISKTRENELLKEIYNKRIRHLYKMEELFR